MPTKGAPRDGIIKFPDTGACGGQLQVILVLQALEQVRMHLEDVAQGPGQIPVVYLVESLMEVVVRDGLQTRGRSC